MKRSTGFGAVAAMVVLVLLALLAAAVVRLSVGSHTAIAQEIQAARTQAALRAGVDWGLFQLIRSTGAWLGCSTPQTQTLELVGSNATVACSALRKGHDCRPAVTQDARASRKVFELDAVRASHGFSTTKSGVTRTACPG